MAIAVQANINYYLDPSLGGITSYVPGTAGILRRKFDTRPVQVQDLRTSKDEFSIHMNSFQVSKFDIPVNEIVDEEMKSVVYPQAEEMIKNMWVNIRGIDLLEILRINIWC
jgi:hypothetical protein